MSRVFLEGYKPLKGGMRVYELLLRQEFFFGLIKRRVKKRVKLPANRKKIKAAKEGWENFMRYQAPLKLQRRK